MIERVKERKPYNKLVQSLAPRTQSTQHGIKKRCKTSVVKYTYKKTSSRLVFFFFFSRYTRVEIVTKNCCLHTRARASMKNSWMNISSTSALYEIKRWAVWNHFIHWLVSLVVSLVSCTQWYHLYTQRSSHLVCIISQWLV